MFFARKKRAAALRATIDQLGDVRTQLRVLRLREQQLREELLSYRPNSYCSGDHYELQVRTKTNRRFLKNKLPDHIRDDPAFWARETHTLLEVTPLDSTRLAPTDENTSDTYGNHDMPEADETSDYGRRTSPDPQLAPVAPMEGLAQAAEPAASFDYTGAPRHKK